MKQIHTDLAPEAIGPYSQAILTLPFLFVSGQLPIDAKTGEIPPSIEQQTLQVLHNIKAILAKAGYEISHVVKVDIFVKDLKNFSVINAIYADFFQDTRPARATVEVSRLPKDAEIEIACIAYKS